MKAVKILLVLGFAFIQQVEARRVKFTAGFNVGHNGGFGLNFYITAAEFAEDFPFIARFSIGHAWRNPGNADSARKIFINDATNGTPEKSGRFWQFDFDFVYNKGGLFIYGGPRLSKFIGNFKFVGGNEDFDVKSMQWGVGFGLEKYYRINRKLKLVLTGGVSYFFDATLYAHDTSYSPDGEDINPRRDYTYEDADRAINQPKFVLRAMIGLNYRLN